MWHVISEVAHAERVNEARSRAAVDARLAVLEVDRLLSQTMAEEDAARVRAAAVASIAAASRLEDAVTALRVALPGNTSVDEMGQLVESVKAPRIRVIMLARKGDGGRFASELLGNLSVNYNRSHSFLPVNPAQDLFKNPLPNPTGSDKSWGLGLNLFNGKLNLRVASPDRTACVVNTTRHPTTRALMGLEAWTPEALETSLKQRTRPDAWWGAEVSPVCQDNLGSTLYDNSLLMGALSGEGLIRMAIDGDTLHESDRWDFGTRIREVEVRDDGTIWLLTDGKDGKLLQLVPKG